MLYRACAAIESNVFVCQFCFSCAMYRFDIERDKLKTEKKLNIKIQTNLNKQNDCRQHTLQLTCHRTAVFSIYFHETFFR